MYQIEIGVYIGSNKAPFFGIFCSTLIYQNKCLDSQGSLHRFTRNVSRLFTVRNLSRLLTENIIKRGCINPYGITIQLSRLIRQIQMDSAC